MSTVPKIDAIVRLHHDATVPQNKKADHVRLVAFAELTIAGHFVIKSIRILVITKNGITGEPFVVFPGEKTRGAGRYYDVAHPCTAEARKLAVDLILDVYSRTP